jgi:FMN phosphatase YigB (HAD superfamily)
MIRAVIFDLGHTVWDIGPVDDAYLARAYDDLHAQLRAHLVRDDLPTATAIRAAVWHVLRDAIPSGFMSADFAQPPSHEWIDRGCRALGLQLEPSLLRRITPPLFAGEIDRLIVADGTAEALHDLAGRGYALGCVTNTLADTPAIRSMLRRYGLEGLMHSVVVSADEGWGKPHPSLFLKAARELDVAPHEAVFVGDSPVHDIRGAKAVGMHAVLTQQYARRPYAEVDPPPDAVIAHLCELPRVIREIECAESGPDGR